VGSRICEADAVGPLVAVAERLGAPVIHEAATSHGRSSFPSDHPLAAGMLPFWSPDVRRRLQEFDVLLVAGMKLLQQYIYHEPARAVPESCRIVHLDDDPWEVGKNYPVEVGVVGHPRVALAELAAELDARMTDDQRRAARRRSQARQSDLAGQRQALRRQGEAEMGLRPITPRGLMELLARVLPHDVAVVEESPTTTDCYFERVGALRNTTGYFAQRGWALGWGLNCAIGVQLAWPERPVLAILGDGSTLYGLQGLWTAAHYRLPVTFLVTNNTQYKILKDCARVLGLPNAMAHQYLGLDLVDPPVDYVRLAEAMGVKACRLGEPDAVSDAVRQSLEGDEPRLIEVPIQAPADQP